MADLSQGEWMNPPPDWVFENGVLDVTTGAKGDFWRNTHYGFLRDNGHFWQLPAPKAFTASLTFEGDYETLYDQAGLMLRLDQERWIKCGIEHSDGMTNFSIVVTRGNSDWSVIGQPLISGPQTVRLTAHNGAIIAHFRAPDGAWQLMRVADFPMSATAMIGPMACSPERAGFKARFLKLEITSPIKNPLHG
jgi:uncharacterized protein